VPSVVRAKRIGSVQPLN